MKCAGRLVAVSTVVAILLGCHGRTVSPAQNEKISHAASASDELLANLTSGSWVRKIGEPPFEDSLVYTFFKEGTYKKALITDYPVEPEEGTWLLTTDDDGRIRLILKNKSDRYYWLPRECFIRYDKKRNSLLVDGFNIGGTQELSRPEK